MRVDVIHVRRAELSHLQCPPKAFCCARSVRPWSRHVMGIVCACKSNNLCINRRITPQGMPPLFQNEHGRTFTHDKTIPISVKWAAGASRILISGGHRANKSKSAETKGSQR